MRSKRPPKNQRLQDDNKLGKRSAKSQRAPEASGRVKRHPDGFGFFIPDESGLPDAYIPKKQMQTLMTQDRVRVRMIRETDGRFSAEVVEILERGVKIATGRIEINNQSFGRLPDHAHAWGDDVIVELGDHSVKEHDWVSVQITSYADSPRGLRGRVTRVIRNIEDPLNDEHRVLAQHGISAEFSRDCQREARELYQNPQLLNPAPRRRDLQNMDFVTIDGATAKDFDDAICVRETRSGFKLWVAIADVSHFVRTGTAIDQEAYSRGTSTYFPNFVVPMLPEELSNDLCSLRPAVPRMTMVAEIHLDRNGDTQATHFYEAIIKSRQRLTYGQAQELIETAETPQEAPWSTSVRRAADLARILQKRRQRGGSLQFELGETTLSIDDTGEPIDVIRTERLFAHQLIEELMLAANVAVANFLSNHEVSALYRIHEEPDAFGLDVFRNFLKTMKTPQRLESGNLQKSLSKILERFRDTPQEPVVNMLTLRAMKQARYSAQNLGHFGLGFANYVHFTSPIRRYPDLMIHRQLKAVIYPDSDYSLVPQDTMAAAGSVLSACEQRSVKAERQYMSIKKARFISRYLGQVFAGVITSVTKFGFFVLLREFDIDGLVKIDTLGSERFHFNEDNLMLVGGRSGQKYAMGDVVSIQVVSSNSDSGQIDFMLAEEIDDTKHKKKPTPQRRPR